MAKRGAVVMPLFLVIISLIKDREKFSEWTNLAKIFTLV